MACVPLAANKQKFQFTGIVNLESLMAVPYVNAVFFTKLWLLNSRNSRQYSKRVAVVDNAVQWNSSHTFQCKVHTNLENNTLESCKLKISVRMESDGGKSFHKIGYVIVDLSCFVASGFTRCCRRYLLKGYDGDRRRAGKRQDNSLLVVSFTCQQVFGSTCFRLPPEDLSNCVSTSQSTDEHDPTTTDGNNPSSTLTTTPVASASGGVSGGGTDLPFTPSAAAVAAASVVLPPILGNVWNEGRVEMRSRRRRKEQVVEVMVEDSLEGEGGRKPVAATSAVDELDALSGAVSPPPAASDPFLVSSSSPDEQLSSGGEFISPASTSIGQEEGEGNEIFSSPMPHQPSSYIPSLSLNLVADETLQRLRREEEAALASISSSSPMSSPSSHGTSTNSSLSTTLYNIDQAVSAIHLRPPSDFSSLPIHSRISGPTTHSGVIGGGGVREGESDALSGGQFHTCPHVRPSSLLSQQSQRKMLGEADSGFHFQGLGVGAGDSLGAMTVAVNERCSLASSGFQSHSRNSSYESTGLPRCFPGDLMTTPMGNAGDCQLSLLGLSIGGGIGGAGSVSGSKQHLIDATRAPHDEVVSQILRTSVIAQRSPTGHSQAAVSDANTCPFG